MYTLSDFGEECSHVPLMCDSISAICVAKNVVLDSRTKHRSALPLFERQC
jgi:hypothetical protein